MSSPNKPLWFFLHSPSRSLSALSQKPEIFLDAWSSPLTFGATVISSGASCIWPALTSRLCLASGPPSFISPRFFQQPLTDLLSAAFQSSISSLQEELYQTPGWARHTQINTSHWLPTFHKMKTNALGSIIQGTTSPGLCLPRWFHILLDGSYFTKMATPMSPVPYTPLTIW